MSHPGASTLRFSVVEHDLEKQTVVASITGTGWRICIRDVSARKLLCWVDGRPARAVVFGGGGGGEGVVSGEDTGVISSGLSDLYFQHQNKA